MDSFYEKSREDDIKVHISRNKPHTYPAHFHQNLEIYILKNGRYTIEIGGVTTEMLPGTVAVIDSYDIHSYIKGIGDMDDCAVIIPYRYLDRFNKERNNLKLANHYICDPELCDKLLSIIDEYLLKKESTEPILDSAIQLFLAVLLDKLEFTETKGRAEEPLIRKILAYIQANLTKDVSRKKIASELGYTEAHISRVFHRYLGRGIQDYVNALRLEYIERMRISGEQKTLTELIYEAGFGSEQSYYRNKNKHKR